MMALSLSGRGLVPFLTGLSGFLWGIFTVGFLCGSAASWQGERTFRGCLSSDSQMGRKMQWVVLNAELDGTRRLPVRLGVPLRRESGKLRSGDCLAGTVTLSSYPDKWERNHLFGSTFRPLLFEGVLSPWDSLHISHPVGKNQFLLPHFSSTEARIQDRFESLFHPDVAAVLLAMVLSDTSHLSPDLLQEFQGSGVYHLLSVSGEHMALLAVFFSGALFLIIRLLPYPWLRVLYARWPISLLIGVCVIPVLGCYLLLIGSPLPALRAVGGFVLVLVARILGFRWSWEDSLGISVVVLCLLNPDSPLSLSLDLSLSALFGVAIFLKAGRRSFEGEPSLEAGFEVRDAVILGSVITVTTLPLLWLEYRQLDWVGIVSNGVIVPVAGDLLLPAGFLYGLFLLFVPSGWGPATFAMEKLGESVVGLVSFFSRIPYGQIPLPPVSPGGFFVLCVAVIGGLAMIANDGGWWTLKKNLLIPTGLILLFIVLTIGMKGPEKPGGGVPLVRAMVKVIPDRPDQILMTGVWAERIEWRSGQEGKNWHWVLGW